MSTYKDTNKWVRNMKFTSKFFKTSASIFETLSSHPVALYFYYSFFIPHKVAKTDSKVKSYTKEK